MKVYEQISHSESETQKLANTIAIHLRPGDVIALEGDLGAGKTTFTKGIAIGLGITRTVNSPTFTIMKEYKGKFPLYHMDVYRVEHEDEEFGIEEYIEGNGVTIVEWAHLINSQLPTNRLTISLQHVDGQSRKIAIEPTGERYEALCKEIFG